MLRFLLMVEAVSDFWLCSSACNRIRQPLTPDFLIREKIRKCCFLSVVAASIAATRERDQPLSVMRLLPPAVTFSHSCHRALVSALCEHVSVCAKDFGRNQRSWIVSVCEGVSGDALLQALFCSLWLWHIFSKKDQIRKQKETPLQVTDWNPVTLSLLYFDVFVERVVESKCDDPSWYSVRKCGAEHASVTSIRRVSLCERGMHHNDGKKVIFFDFSCQTNYEEKCRKLLIDSQSIA